ncbi:MAG: HigA family addiction module antitoxin [Gammaproteobacteria bacterium]
MKQPKKPFHPGEILLEEFLEPAGITQNELARKLGWTRVRLNELIKGNLVTADAALDVTEALGMSAKLWMNLPTYDLDQAMGHRKTTRHRRKTFPSYVNQCIAPKFYG